MSLLPSLLLTAGLLAPSPEPFEVRLDVDLALVAGGLALWVTPVLLESELEGRECAPCDRSNISGLDRHVVDYDNGTARTLGHVGAIAIPTLAFASALGRWGSDGTKAVVTDTILLAETMVISGALNQLVRHVYARPRPYMYRDPVPKSRRLGNEDWRSFYSGHTAAAFSTATAAAYLYTVRRPDSEWVPWVWATAGILAGGTGISRVLAGDHFWSDVLVGGAVGAGFGMLIPALHRRDPNESLRLMAGPGGLTIGGVFP